MDYDEVNPIENGIQQVYIDVRESLELILLGTFNSVAPTSDMAQKIQIVLTSLDDAIANNWDELMLAFWRGVKQDIELMDSDLYVGVPYQPDPTDFMDDDEIAVHNKAMEEDPQYRDAIHHERN